MKHVKLIIAAIAAVTLFSCTELPDNHYADAEKNIIVDFDYEFDKADSDSLTVIFTNRSSSFVHIVAWDFGDSTMVTYRVGVDVPETKITHQYKQAG